MSGRLHLARSVLWRPHPMRGLGVTDLRPFGRPVWLSVERGESRVHHVPVPPASGVNGGYRGHAVGIVEGSRGHRREPDRPIVSAEKGATTARTKRSCHDAIGRRLQTVFGSFPTNRDRGRRKDRARSVPGPTDPLAVRAMTMRHDDRIAFDLVPDRAAETSSSKHGEPLPLIRVTGGLAAADGLTLGPWNGPRGVTNL